MVNSGRRNHTKLPTSYLYRAIGKLQDCTSPFLAIMIISIAMCLSPAPFISWAQPKCSTNPTTVPLSTLYRKGKEGTEKESGWPKATQGGSAELSRVPCSLTTCRTHVSASMHVLGRRPLSTEQTFSMWPLCQACQQGSKSGGFMMQTAAYQGTDSG